MLKDITNILNNPEQREKYINKVSSNLFKKTKTLKNKNILTQNNSKKITNTFQSFSNNKSKEKTISNMSILNDDYDDEDNISYSFKIHPLISSNYKNNELYKINFIQKYFKSSKFNKNNSDNNFKKIYLENNLESPVNFLNKKKSIFLSDKKNFSSTIKFNNEENNSYTVFPLFNDFDIFPFDNLNNNLIISNIDDDQNSMKKDLDYGYEMTMKNLESTIKDIKNSKIIDTQN